MSFNIYSNNNESSNITMIEAQVEKQQISTDDDNLQKYRENCKDVTKEFYQILDSYKELTGLYAEKFLQRYYSNHIGDISSYQIIKVNLESEAELINILKSNGLTFDKEAIFKTEASECKKQINDFKNRERINNVLKEHNIDIKEMFNAGNITEFSIDGANKVIELLERNKNSNIENFDLRVKKAYYCGIFNINEKDINNNQKFLENFITAAQTVIERNNNSDKFNDKKLARQNVLEYTVALNYDWDCIEDFEKFQRKDNDTLVDRFTKLGLLGKNPSEGDIRNACKKYFDSFKSLKKPKSSDSKLSEKEWSNKLFRQTFGKLLINSINECKKNNNNDLLVLFESIQKEYLDEAVDNAYTLATGNDVASQGVASATSELSADKIKEISPLNIGRTGEKGSTETVKKIQETTVNIVINSSKNDKFNFEEIKNKIENGLELTPEENEFVKSNEALAALLKGIENNKNVKQENKIIISSDATKKIQESGENSYRLLNYSIKKAIDSDDISDVKKAKLSKYFDLITNNNFSAIAENPNVKLNPPADAETLIKSNETEIGLKTKNEFEISTAKDSISQIEQTINEQTKSVQESDKYVIESNPTNKELIDKTENEPSKFIETTAAIILQNVQTISIADIREYSISLTPLIKQFSSLTTSVQNHIKTRLESRSEEEQVRSIDQMDKNSDKVDMAIELKISDVKLEKLHLDTNARKNLELKEDVA